MTAPSGEVPQMNISYKPQKISPKSTGTVRQMLHEKIRDAYIHPQVSRADTECTIPLLKVHRLIEKMAAI